jgi:hypothetical protein
VLSALARGKEEEGHWVIDESALEFHPLYCKEDLVLLNTSCLLFFFSFHKLVVTASWSWRLGREGRPEEEGCSRGQRRRSLMSRGGIERVCVCAVVGLFCQHFCLLLHSL